MSIVVSKFGGTSMGDFAAMQNAALISSERGSTVVCVSAMSGITDRLIETAKLASVSKLEECERIVFTIQEKHLTLLAQIGNRQETATLLAQYFTELELLVQNISLLKELTPKAFDQIQSLGERMSSLLFCDVLKAK